MTKAQRILDLYFQALGTMPKNKLPKFVAAQVGTTASYVRTVARQRKGRGECEAEVRYRHSPLGRAMRSRHFKKRYHSDPVFREKNLERSARRYAKRRAEARA